jgi:hypothetical protein
MNKSENGGVGNSSLPMDKQLPAIAQKNLEKEN